MKGTLRGTSRCLELGVLVEIGVGLGGRLGGRLQRGLKTGLVVKSGQVKVRSGPVLV